MQGSVSEDSIAELVHIAKYLTAKSKNKNLDDSHFHCKKYGGFMADLIWMDYIYQQIPYVSRLYSI